MPVSREEQAGVGNGEWWGIEIAVEIAQTVRFLHFATSVLLHPAMRSSGPASPCALSFL